MVAGECNVPNASLKIPPDKQDQTSGHERLGASEQEHLDALQRFAFVIGVEFVKMKPVPPKQKIGKDANRHDCEVDVEFASKSHVSAQS